MAAGAEAMGLRIRQRAPQKFRARRAPCRWQGAADLKAQAPLPPAPQHELEALILVSGTWLEEFGCLLLMLGGSQGLIFGLLECLGTSF